MLLNIKFSNFRSFKNEAVFTFEANTSKAKMQNVFEVNIGKGKTAKPIRLLKRCLIYGANASGKTNVILALFILKNLIIGKVSEYKKVYDPFRFDTETMNAPSSISLEFLIEKVKYLYAIKYDRNSILEEDLFFYPNNKKTLIFKRETDENSAVISYGATLKRGAAQKLPIFKDKLLLTQFFDYVNDKDITPVAKYLGNMIVINGYHTTMQNKLLESGIDYLKKNPSDLSNLAEMIKASDTGIRNLKINEKPLSNEDRMKFYHREDENENTKLNLLDESKGTQMIFLIGAMLLKAMHNGSPIFIDEMDASLHTYITRWLLDIINSDKINTKHSQILLTSHDINLLDESRIRRDQVWFTEKDSEGVSDLFSLADFEDVREDTPFAKWYLHNKFGAVPKIGDIESLFDN